MVRLILMQASPTLISTKAKDLHGIYMWYRWTSQRWQIDDL
ncbi:MAG: hypothetical protein RL518_811 [Pseudomonadota bacterium]|jgi:hypothetical protein